MFVVMAVGATEAEIIGVKSHILAEGMTPYEHAGVERIVIAVVGEVGPRKVVLQSRLSALPGVESVAPISRRSSDQPRVHPEDTVIRVLDAVIAMARSPSWPPVLGGDAATSCSRPPRQ